MSKNYRQICIVTIVALVIVGAAYVVFTMPRPMITSQTPQSGLPSAGPIQPDAIVWPTDPRQRQLVEIVDQLLRPAAHQVITMTPTQARLVRKQVMDQLKMRLLAAGYLKLSASIHWEDQLTNLLLNLDGAHYNVSWQEHIPLEVRFERCVFDQVVTRPWLKKPVHVHEVDVSLYPRPEILAMTLGQTIPDYYTILLRPALMKGGVGQSLILCDPSSARPLAELATAFARATSQTEIVSLTRDLYRTRFWIDHGREITAQTPWQQVVYSHLYQALLGHELRHVQYPRTAKHQGLKHGFEEILPSLHDVAGPNPYFGLERINDMLIKKDATNAMSGYAWAGHILYDSAMRDAAFQKQVPTKTLASYLKDNPRPGLPKEMMLTGWWYVCQLPVKDLQRIARAAIKVAEHEYNHP